MHDPNERDIMAPDYVDVGPVDHEDRILGLSAEDAEYAFYLEDTLFYDFMTERGGTNAEVPRR